MDKVKREILEILVNVPGLKRFRPYFYKKLGINIRGKLNYIDLKVRYKYENITLGNNVDIRDGCLFIAHDKIEIGENTGIGYDTLILTGSDPNNGLSKIYKRTKAPVSIGHDCWIGAKSVIFPGVKIGNYCIVATGAVVRKDVPDFSVIGGIPAKIIKELNPKDFK